jgi:DUF4097 and DUF4098 domain-containing protein YvlB
MMRLLAAGAAFVLSSWAVVGAADDRPINDGDATEVSFAYVPAPNAESVTIEQPMGRLSLHGWDKPEVRIVARKHAREAATLDRLRVNVEMQDGRIRIRTGVRIGQGFRALPPSPSSASAGIDLTVDAPRSVQVRAKTWAGDLDAEGFRAGAELASTGGEVRASDIGGKVRSNSVKGKQHLTAIHGDVEADGVAGDVELDTVDGEVLDARVVEGQITAREVRTPVVRLFSTAGGVVFVGAVRPGGRYDLHTEEGDVHLVLRAAPFSLTARAPTGRVRSGFRLDGASTPTLVHGDYLGGGATLDLAALHGDVTIEPR